MKEFIAGTKENHLGQQVIEAFKQIVERMGKFFGKEDWRLVVTTITHLFDDTLPSILAPYKRNLSPPHQDDDASSEINEDDLQEKEPKTSVSINRCTM